MKIRYNFLILIFYILFFSLIASFFFIRYINRVLGSSISKYGEAEARRVVSIIINNSVSSDIFSDNGDDMLIINRNSDGDIETIDFNSVVIYKYLDMITDKIQNNLNYVIDGEINKLNVDLRSISDIDYDEVCNGIVYSIPISGVIGSGFVGNIGPKIPIKLIMIGDVMGDIDSDIKEYGINNVMICLNINVKVEIMVNMSLVSKKIIVRNKIPILMRVVQGDVPNYFSFQK